MLAVICDSTPFLQLRCPQGLPSLSSEALLVGFDHTQGLAAHAARCKPAPMQQRVVEQRAHEAATRLQSDAQRTTSLEQVAQLQELAQS